MRPARLLFLILGMLAGCTGVTERQQVERPPQLAWPAPPEQARFIYETALRNSRSIAVDSPEEKLRKAVTGAGDESPILLKKAFGVAARNGRIYVTDTEARSVYAFDVPRRRFFSFGYRFEGRLTRPAGISVDAKGAVYVADSTACRVVKYDALGPYMRSFGSRGELDRPTAAVADAEAGRVYVVDTGGVESDRHRVVVYDMEGRMTGTIGSRGAGDGQFNLPVDAALGPDGTLYVLDAGNFRVQAFDRSGKFLRRFGSVGISPGQFARPRAIAADRAGNLYVTDAGFCNLQIFNPQGELLLTVGDRGSKDEPARYGLTAGVAVDETGRIYVVDQFFAKVEVFRPSDRDPARN